MQDRRDVPRSARTAAEWAHINKLREAELGTLKELKELQHTLDACEHHFHSVQRQHMCREAWEQCLPAGSVLIQMDYAENMTLPLGPVEEQTWFWATSRLSVSTLGIYVRYDSQGKEFRRYFHYLSQILDHTALHAATALQDIWKRLGLGAEYKDLHIWTDCGPHYRAYAFLAAGIELMKSYVSLNNVFYHYFGEHHGKGRNDGQFGLQRRWVEDFTMKKTISTLDELLGALRQGAANTMKSDPPPKGPEYNIVHFRPKKPQKYLYLDTSGTNLKVEFTYCVGLKRHQGPTFRAILKDFIYSDTCFQTQKARNCGMAVCVERASQAEDWRWSYRTDSPEKEPLPESLLRRRLEHQKSAKTFLACRRSTEMARLLKEEEQRARKSAKDKRESKVFAQGSSSASESSDAESSSSSSSAPGQT